MLGAGGGRVSDGMSVSLASYFKRIEPSSLPTTGPLLAWTPEGIDPAGESEAIEIGSGIVLITEQPPANDPPGGGQGIDA